MWIRFLRKSSNSNNLVNTSSLTRDLVIVVINSSKAYISKNIIIASIIVASIISFYNSFIERVVSLKNIYINNNELKYDLIINKNNENNNDILAIIEEKIDEKNEDFYILFKNNSRIESNILR